MCQKLAHSQQCGECLLDLILHFVSQRTETRWLAKRKMVFCLEKTHGAVLLLDKALLLGYYFFSCAFQVMNWTKLALTKFMYSSRCALWDLQETSTITRNNKLALWQRFYKKKVRGPSKFGNTVVNLKNKDLKNAFQINLMLEIKTWRGRITYFHDSLIESKALLENSRLKT